MFGKTNVNYSPIKVDCQYDPCKSLKQFLDERSTNRTKLFYGGGNFKCNIQSFGVESSPIKMDINTIISKIQEENEINKSLKKNLTLVFYLSSSESFSSPIVSIEQDTIRIKKGERLQLTCSVEGDYNTLLWEPSIGLSCSNCGLCTLTDIRGKTTKQCLPGTKNGSFFNEYCAGKTWSYYDDATKAKIKADAEAKAKGASLNSRRGNKTGF